MNNVIDVAAAITALAAVISIIVITTKLGHMSGEVQASLLAQKADIGEMREDLKALNAVVTQLAVTQERLDAMASHIIRIDKRVDMLAQGEGFIFPLTFPPKIKPE